MSRSIFAAAIAAVGVVAGFGSAAHAVLIDDFGTAASAANYTRYTVLDSDATPDSSVASPSGVLSVTRGGQGTATTGPEQSLYLRSYSIPVGQQLRVDYANVASTLYADFGIAIAAPQTSVVYNTGTGGNQSSRANYVAVYANASQGLVKTIGFDGTTQLTSPAGVSAALANVSAFFITHTSANQYVTGYTLNGVDTTFGTFNFTAANAALFSNVGLYSDLRAVGTNGSLDNLSAVPEPAALAVLGLGTLAGLRRRRA